MKKSNGYRLLRAYLESDGVSRFDGAGRAKCFPRSGGLPYSDCVRPEPFPLKERWPYLRAVFLCELFDDILHGGIGGHRHVRPARAGPRDK